MEAAPDMPWWQATSIYQIYPRSFRDGNGDGIGDLRGIIDSLGHVQDLGCETIWISPFYASPQRDFGYDISDFEAIAPEYGSLAEVDELIAAVHGRGMKIVFDMVLNHTSDQHPWFRESAGSRENARADWYIWRDGRGSDGLQPPTNWESLPGGNGWHYVPTRKQWYFASFLPFQPDLNYHNPAVRAAMMDVLRHWLRLGVDGFRLDIFNAIVKDPQFKDNPFSWRYIPTKDGMHARWQRRSHTVNLPANFQLAREVRAVVDEFPDRFLVGEVFGQHGTIKQFLGDDGKGLNLIFLFDMLFLKWDARFFRERLAEYELHYPAPHVPTFVMGNHDTKRWITRVGGRLDRAKLIALLQMTTRGVPVIYYGEEVGMLEAEIPKANALDPVSDMYRWVPDWLRRRLPIALNRDVCRSPMQWSDRPNAGFCPDAVRPWLPIAPEASARNVASQAAFASSLLHTYRTCLRLRKRLDVLRAGSLTLLPAHTLPQQVLAYARDHAGTRALVLANFGDARAQVKVEGNWRIAHAVGEATIMGEQAVLAGCAGMVLIQGTESGKLDDPTAA